MNYTIVGLGNPGEEYELTRHNTGRIVLSALHKKENLSPFKLDKKLKALVSEGKIGKDKIEVIFPETFMNKSGVSITPLIKNKKQAERLIVVHDDLDLPLGTMKISFNRGSGGHKGIESIIKAIKTEAFVRVRIGVSPKTTKGKAKKPKGEEKIVNFIIGKFSKIEQETLKKVGKQVSEAIVTLVKDGREKAMGDFN
ncbi:MAG: peptidyl-tRNA hydrolase, PTH1 family [Parcubacteria group bacterium LiPW_30]|nr:MAG: peptidyl-tRNA hydrolase, PTH1 family [Parcubacteria group bacterium LiPW_30]